MGRRVFILSGRKFNGNCGGSAGVNYRLLLANNKYKLIDSMYHLFVNCSFEPMTSCEFDIPKKNLHSYIRKIGVKAGVVFLLKAILNRGRLSIILEKYNTLYKFSNDDVYILHDPQIAYAFLKKFRFNKTLFMYHQQGEAYYEWKSLFKSKSLLVKKYYSYIEKYILTYTQDVGFPSNGACYSFNITSDKDTKISNYLVLYNGVPAINNGNNTIKQYLLGQREIVFLTVAVLNDAKGVEKIPELIKRLKDNLSEYKIRWILVGDGSHHKEVEEQIIKWDICKNVNWITESLPHETIIEMMKEAHFYIMMHNFSIFDFATIEAMSAGCVPILSNVPANIEVGKDDNIVVINKPLDIDIINESFMSEKYTILSKKNVEVQKTYFDDLAFLKGYINYINER